MPTYQIEVRYTVSTYVAITAPTLEDAGEEVQGELELIIDGHLDYYEIISAQEELPA
jgi:hypothetical protein